ncbi:response regulator PleD [bacterium BMS3Bbin12]|nr:response regulator PleD [bacterium BMS3Abin12]GBE47278.1 response regulator PleD [bacterium BMS3Bbin12]GBE50669.1 response regulator PleD [bacterium BMS3Bbin13]HDK02664.1 GGDEF domain-containing protein [Gammaproteobacteria bacterium]
MSREPLRDVVRDLQDGVLNLLDALSVLGATWALPADGQGEEALLSAVLEIVLGHPSVQSASIHLLRGERLERVAARDVADLLGPDAPAPGPLPGAERIAPGEGVIGRAAVAATLQHCADCAQEPAGPGQPNAGSLIAAPIPGSDGTPEVLGVLSLAHADPGQFTRWHERLAATLAGAVGQLLHSNRLARDLETEVRKRTRALSDALDESQRLRKRFEEWALVDELTGLRNRRFFFSEGEILVQRSLRYDDSLSLIMLDLDRFKKINDTWGHGQGDAVLREIAQLLEAGMRRGDLLARFGGEEFVLLLSHTDCDGAKRFGERLCKRVAQHPLRHQDTERRTTITVGVSCHRPGHPEDSAQLLAQLIREADEALYYGKAHGRNCVHTYPDLSPPGITPPKGTS